MSNTAKQALEASLKIFTIWLSGPVWRMQKERCRGKRPFYKNSFVGIMLDWIKQGMKEDYSEIVDNMVLTLHGSITNSVQNFLSKTDP